ncbi:MAG: RluA family pseudouridine synthase [Bacteroidetes bacterium]|nr:RluA family pseudouridine synthase [Bacteroidota bacterium]
MKEEEAYFANEGGEQDELFEHLRIEVDKGQGPVRIDKFLYGRIENTSRNKIQTATDAGSVFVNGLAVKSSYKVKPLDLITLVLSKPPREIELYPDPIPLSIIYEDDSIIVIDKPAGMVVHPAYGNYRGTLINAVIHHLHPELDGKPLKSESQRPGLVHRIDKNTSGLIVLAKTEEALTFLAKQFFDRTTKRHYYEFVWGNVVLDEGTIPGNIGRSVRDRKVMDVFEDTTVGKHAVTHFKVLERFSYTTLLQCKLETGRTHQIRVHFKYIKHPLFNDNEYGGDRILKGTVFQKYRQFVENCFEILPRQALHAASLGFIHPKTKKEMYFESPIPADFATVLERWRAYSHEPK